MRDQLWRGVTIIERLIREDVLRPGEIVLVVGAGLAGATAAVEAARQGCNALLIDAAARPFTTQRNVATRFIDPTQYDWPLDHYREGRLPWDIQHRDLPFPIKATTASAIALAWTRQLIDWQRKLKGRLQIEYLTSIMSTSKPVVLGGKLTRRVAIELTSGKVVHPNIIIDATGFGLERCRFPTTGVPAFIGQPFWSNDQFSKLSASTRNVLISGGGDGALQDLVRVLTHQDHPATVADSLNLPLDLLRHIQSAEERAHRGRAWSSPTKPRFLQPSLEGPFLSELDRLHNLAADDALLNPLVQEGLEELLFQRPISVTLVHPEPYLTCYYGLNRFLTHLLMKYLAPLGTHHWWKGCHVASLHAAAETPHTCVDEHASGFRAAGVYNSEGFLMKHECLGKLHHVTFEPDDAGGSAAPPGDYDVIILRHGIGQVTGLPLPQPRQLTPMHIPN